MEWLENNWIWIAAGVAFFAMHLFGHSNHSGHRRGGGDDSRNPKPSDDVTTAEQTADVNGVALRVTNPTIAALGGMPVHTGAAPTPSNGKQHHRGC